MNPLTGFPNLTILKSQNGKFIFILTTMVVLLLLSSYFIFVHNDMVPVRFKFANWIGSNSMNKKVNVTKTKAIRQNLNLSISTIHILKNSQVQIDNANVSYPGYLDTNFSKDCGIPPNHKEFFDLMKFWINFTTTHSIPWWLAYGSLIGSLRHKDMVPWDGDADVGILTQYESLLRKLSTPRSKISYKNVSIVTRPGPHCPYNGPRTDCQGKSVTSQVDGCAFCGPVARVFYRPSVRIDVYLYDFQVHANELKIIDEGTFEYSSEPPHSPIDWYFPLRTCSFMNMTLQCPRKSETVLNKIYGTFKSHYVCEKGYWKKID